MADGIAVERVTGETVEELVTMLGGLADSGGRRGPDIEEAERLRRDALADAPPFEAHLAMVDGQAAGCVTLYPTYSTFRAARVLFLEDLYVHEAYRRKGVARALLAFVRERARQLGCTAVQWNTRRTNEAARRFYGSLGADQWGSELVWYRIDA